MQVCILFCVVILPVAVQNSYIKTIKPERKKERQQKKSTLLSCCKKNPKNKNHSFKIWLQDLKPGNLAVNEDCELKVRYVYLKKHPDVLEGRRQQVRQLWTYWLVSVLGQAFCS